MKPEEIQETLMEHRFRLESYDRLFQQHNQELVALKESMTQLKDELGKVTNRLIIALIVVTALGENAMPILLKLTGG
jgi:chromosome segregation ATPase